MRYEVFFAQLTDAQREELAEALETTISELEDRNNEEPVSMMVDFDDLTDEQKEFLYDNDEERNFFRCYNCGEIFEVCDEISIYDGDDDYRYSVCQSCLDSGDYEEDNYNGDYYESGDMVTVNPGTNDEMRVYRNSQCLEDTFICDSCGRIFDDNYRNSDEYRCLCDDCYDDGEWIRCDDCDALMRYPDIYYVGDGRYCVDCYQDHSDPITGYHHDNNQNVLTFRKMPDESDQITEYLGVEIEVEANDSPYCGELNNRAQDIKDVVPWDFMIKEDGSLTDGFEMVTDPCSLRFLIERFPWEDISRVNIQNNMRSDQAHNCGLHVHISRNALGETEEEQDMVIAKLIILFERFKPEIEKFARRRSTRWANFYQFASNKSDFSELSKEMKTVLKNKGGTGLGERYHAINITNKHTVEFRVFKGSLNVETIKASIEFVHEVVQFAKAASLIKIQNCVWTDIAHNTEYEDLKSYLKRRNLFWNGCQS